MLFCVFLGSEMFMDFYASYNRLNHVTFGILIFSTSVPDVVKPFHFFSSLEHIDRMLLIFNSNFLLPKLVVSVVHMLTIPQALVQKVFLNKFHFIVVPLFHLLVIFYSNFIFRFILENDFYPECWSGKQWIMFAKWKVMTKPGPMSMRTHCY